MQKSAFKYHEVSQEPVNTLQYYSALKRARNLASPEDIDTKKRKSLDKSEDSQGLCDIFSVQRPLSTVRETCGHKASKQLQPGKRIDLLVFEIIKYFHSNSDSNITLDYLSEKLLIEKRKIYDLINLFNSFELIKRVGKGCYTWSGVESMEAKILAVRKD